jgi:hypothetical protein
VVVCPLLPERAAAPDATSPPEKMGERQMMVWAWRARAARHIALRRRSCFVSVL